MKHIVTRANPDGSFDEVGMNNRTVMEWRQRWRLDREALSFACGRAVRIETYHGKSMLEPDKGRVRFLQPIDKESAQ